VDTAFKAYFGGMERITVIGGGLAGCSAALTLARLGHEVDLWEMRPLQQTPAHSTENLAELVCSNSFKGLGLTGAHGLLKEELRRWGSEMIEAAFEARVPAGESLAIDRELFSQAVERRIAAQPRIRLHRGEVTTIDPDAWTIVAAGPLASASLTRHLLEMVGGGRLSFFDAIAPVVTLESLDWDHCWRANRWDKGETTDFINCSLNKEEYHAFVAGLVAADAVEPKPFEPKELFEGCLPIEEMARRGPETLCHGPLRPVGLDDPKTGRWPHAVLQLRSENREGTLFNLVGCQTRLRFGEQKRLFGLIPALKNAEFARLGAMHRNTFLDSPSLLDRDFSLRVSPRTFLAGQITGAEGYTEALATGFHAAVSLHQKLTDSVIPLPEESMLGSLVRFLTTPRGEKAPVFQPMNAHFGLLPDPPVPEGKRKHDKSVKKDLQAAAAIDGAVKWAKQVLPWGVVGN
jgi:methylenetetrahydrofolate--tRNA-(uracil-5-)-methyltransferase